MKIAKRGVLMYFSGPAGPVVHFSGWEFTLELGETMPSNEQDLLRAHLRLVVEQIASAAGIDMAAEQTKRVAKLFVLNNLEGAPPAIGGTTPVESSNGVQEEGRPPT
jgi:hypothetical protein